MKRIYIIVVSSVLLAGCSGFLDVTPNKSGSSDIYHMDQLYNLTGNHELFTKNNYCWQDLIFLGDGVEFSPYYVVTTLSSGKDYMVYTWSRETMEKETGFSTCTWLPFTNAVYAYNTVLEYMDRVVQTTPEIRKEVEGEALFGRAYYHFIALVQYALWDDEAPGIGYRTNTLLQDIPTRETVKYTLDHIYQDLDDAEKALTEAGRTKFEPERNFRPTVPAVKALRARIDLYRGNYTSALENAEAALAAYNVLVDFKEDPLYDVTEKANIYMLDRDSVIVDTIKYYEMVQLFGKKEEVAWQYPEFYTPHYVTMYYSNISIPISQSYYDLFDHENDERWKRFYHNNYIVKAKIIRTLKLPGFDKSIASCFTWDDQQGVKEANRHVYRRFSCSPGKGYLLGTTTAEMYLIKAECLARAGRTNEAAEALRTLRRTRFTTPESADDIGGSINEVLEERAREMTEIWRFFDIKRLNAVENANIWIRREILTELTNINSATTLEIPPDHPGWAVPFNYQEWLLMGWDQN